uniref:Mediator of RNA polymerase II transcription subunit 23 n=1 Tax=Trichuris muris TaxID=70415 RepID=A0A5S6Q811_TRIMR
MSSPQEAFKQKFTTVFSDYMGSSKVQAHFASYVKHCSPLEERCKVKAAADSLFEAFHALPAESLESAFTDVVNRRSMSAAANLLVNNFIGRVLEERLLPVKTMCIILLRSPSLTVNNYYVWRDTFQFLLENVSTLDYKSVRDVFKLVTELPIPVHLQSDQRKAVEISEKVTAHICSRETNLLPAYLMITEIRKSYSEMRCFSHWRVADVFTELVESFRPLAQMNSINGRSHLTPVVGHVGLYFNAFWRLEPQTLRFPLKGCLPFSQNLMQPQYHLVYQVFMHATYRDAMSTLFSLQKQDKIHLPFLEEVIAAIILELMYEAECDHSQLNPDAWRLISTQIVCLCMQMFISFTRLVNNLHKKLSSLPYRFARNQLMWCLFNFVSFGVQQKEEFLAVLDLYRLLYSGNDTFIMSGSDSSCVLKMAATCIWIHAMQKLPSGEIKIPPTINTQMKFLQEALKKKGRFSIDNYVLAVLCNAYSSTSDLFHQELLPCLIEHLDSHNLCGQAPLMTGPSPAVPTVMLPGGAVADNRVRPLKFEFMDCLSVHVRASITRSAFGGFMRFMQNKGSVCPSPALVESYCRLLSYGDAEMLGLKQFVSNLVVAATKQQCLSTIHIICEITSYRLSYIPVLYRVHLLCSIHVAINSAVLQQNATVYWMLENTLLRSIHWFPYCEVFQPSFSRLLSMLIANAGEGARPQEGGDETLKAVILVLARSSAIANSDFNIKDGIYRDILAKVPAYMWPQSTLQFFPQPLCAFYGHQQGMAPTPHNYMLLRQQVEEEYIKHRTFGADLSIIDYFVNTSTNTVYLCLLWRLVYETGELPSVSMKILEALGPRRVLIHLQTLADFLVYETLHGDVNRCVDVLNRMIFKYAVIPLERFVLTMIFRHYEGNEAFYAMLIVMLLIQRSEEFKSAVNDCVATLPADANLCQDGYEKHVIYHHKHPEKTWAQVFAEMNRTTPASASDSIVPVYYSNCCLRMLPILDMMFHRMIEIPTVCSKFLDATVSIVGPLYRFHPFPISFLYTTFRFYEKRLNESPQTKLKLAYAMHLAFQNIRDEQWLLSSELIAYCSSLTDAAMGSSSSFDGGQPKWAPDMQYFAKLVKRLVDTFAQPRRHGCKRNELRFCEFSNAQAHILHCVCVELMALPCGAAEVGHALINLLLCWHPMVDKYVVHYWLNALGLILTALPVPYVEPMYQAIVNLLASKELECIKDNISAKLDFEHQWLLMCDLYPARLLALAHAVWCHSTSGGLQLLVQAVKTSWKLQVKTETQFLYICHLIAPLLLRLSQERSLFCFDVGIAVYEMLYNVDKQVAELRYEDLISDFLYHIKYMFLGDCVRQEADRVISQLRPSLQRKLRYISFAQPDQSNAASTSQ